jgi:hypothetical protein
MYATEDDGSCNTQSEGDRSSGDRGESAKRCAVSEVRVSGFLSTGQQLACLYSGEDRTAGDPYLGRTVSVAFDAASVPCA